MQQQSAQSWVMVVDVAAEVVFAVIMVVDIAVEVVFQLLFTLRP